MSAAGNILWFDFIVPLNLTRDQVEKLTSLPYEIIGKIVAGTQPITPHIADCLGRAFQTDADFWMEIDKAEIISDPKQGDLVVFEDLQEECPNCAGEDLKRLDPIDHNIKVHCGGCEGVWLEKALLH